MKPGLTLEQHASIGLELAQIRDRLTTISVMISNSYPKTANVGHKGQRAVRELDELRSQLEDRMFVEHPDARDSHIYYPHER